VGLIAIVLIVVLFYLAFTKSLPWSGGYELKAVVKNAQNLAVKSPVRVAGVEVGKVTGVDGVSDASGNGAQAAVVTMNIKDNGRPVHTDAKIKLRPRLFLEGNLFVELQPGSPSAPEAGSGFTIPVQHTANSVQIDQVLTTLQADVRQDLQVLLKELGDAFIKYGGAEGFRTFFQTSALANRSTAEVNQAFLGTEPDDLSNLVVNLDRTVKGLGQNEEQLKGLVSSLSTVTGSFAAESQALEKAIALLPQVLSEGRPALASLNAAFPSIRAFARDALPAARTAGPALDAANPWIVQLRELVSQDELRGLIGDLRPTIPALANLNSTLPDFFEETRALSSCFEHVIIPWGNDTVQPAAIAGEPAAGEVYKETGYGLVGIAGESRSGDANGQYIRVEAGGGANTVVFPGGPAGSGIEKTVGITPFELLGYEPAINSSEKPPFRPDVPCETQDTPNLSSGGAADPPQQMSSRQRSALSASQKADILSNAKALQALLTQDSRSQPRGKRPASLQRQMASAFKDLINAGPSGEQIIGGGR
jgi:virulence factor Mce-like protein